MKTYCKLCSKDKNKHQKETLHCPLSSRSLMPSYSTEHVYEEVQEILHTPNAVLTVKWKSSIPNVTDGESTTIVEWRGHELIDDDGDVMQFGYQSVQGVEFTFFVTADSTGQVSEVQVKPDGNFYADDGYGEEKSQNIQVQLNGVNDDTIGDFLKLGESNDIPVYTIDELKTRIDNYIIPLWDKKWVLNEITQQYSVYGHQGIGWIQRVLADEDGSIILGKPQEDDDYQLYFGLKNDDQGILEYVFRDKWADFDDSNFVLFGSSECEMEIYEETYKKFTPFFTEVLGRSLCAPDAIKVYSTSDCKAFLKTEYNVQKAKRIKKEKWGKIEYRIFEDDNGEQYTIVTYCDKLISHYPFAYNEDY